MNKAQWKVIYRFCFILSGLLLFKVVTGIYADWEVYEIIEEILTDLCFFLAIVLIGAGIVIRKGVKHG